MLEEALHEIMVGAKDAIWRPIARGPGRPTGGEGGYIPKTFTIYSNSNIAARFVSTKGNCTGKILVTTI